MSSKKVSIDGADEFVFRPNHHGQDFVDLLSASPRRIFIVPEQTEDSRWFGHAGDLGDIVYALPTIRAAGGGDLYLFHSSITTHPMTPQRAAWIIPLLEAQAYITSAEYSHEKRYHRLNDFRGAPGCNLADMHLATYGFGWKERNTKWLNVEPDRRSPVVVHRSSRYRNANFDWKAIVQHYRDDLAFIGHEDEHATFCKETGRRIPYIPTPDLLSLAQVIAGSQLFIGNQSCPAAIAEGLKHPMILEVCPQQNNCIFERMGRINLWDQHVELPRVMELA